MKRFPKGSRFFVFLDKLARVTPLRGLPSHCDYSARYLAKRQTRTKKERYASQLAIVLFIVLLV